MSVETTRPRIIAMWKQVTGVGKVYDNIPRVIQQAHFPAVIVFPGEMDLSQLSSDMNEDDRIYRSWLILDEFGLGTESQAELNADPWFSRVRDHFAARPGLELDNVAVADLPQDLVFNSSFEGDSGFSIRPYGGKDYAVIEFRLRVNEYAATAYQD
jgi:hypothetical protein